jgi:hypothetical protein
MLMITFVGKNHRGAEDHPINSHVSYILIHLEVTDVGNIYDHNCLNYSGLGEMIKISRLGQEMLTTPITLLSIIMLKLCPCAQSEVCTHKS